MTEQTVPIGTDPNSVRKVVNVDAPQATAWQRELDCGADAGADGFGVQRDEGRSGCDYGFAGG